MVMEKARVMGIRRFKNETSKRRENTRASQLSGAERRREEQCEIGQQQVVWTWLSCEDWTESEDWILGWSHSAEQSNTYGESHVSLWSSEESGLIKASRDNPEAILHQMVFVIILG